MTTVDGVARPWVSAEGGSYGYRRLAAGGRVADAGGGALTLVGPVKRYDGPWEEPEHLRHYAGFAKYARPLGAGAVEASVHAYRATWRPTEQIPERIIGSPVCGDAFCSPDPSARGETTRLIGNVAVRQPDWRANVYGQIYKWSMYSNPTYADPNGTSAQIRQFDRRYILGGTAARDGTVGPDLSLRLGTEARYDHIGNVGVAQTSARAFLASLGRYHVEEASGALYAETTRRPFAGFRVVGGLRADHYHYAVRARDVEAAALGEGRGDDTIVSPKRSLAYVLTPQVELCGNWGPGFHSNGARGAVNVDTPVPLLVRGTGRELGVRWQSSALTLTATYWWLGVGNELRFVGDSNAVKPSGASSRHGYELVAFWRPARWPAIDGNYTVITPATTTATTSPTPSRTPRRQGRRSCWTTGRPVCACAISGISARRGRRRARQGPHGRERPRRVERRQHRALRGDPQPVRQP